MDDATVVAVLLMGYAPMAAAIYRLWQRGNKGEDDRLADAQRNYADRVAEIRADYDAALKRETARADKWERVALEGRQEMRKIAMDAETAMKAARKERDQ